MSRRRTVLALLALVTLAASPVLAQQVSGAAFEDRNANGIRDAGEPALPGVTVELFGQSDATGALDTSLQTDATGLFSVGLYTLTDGSGEMRVMTTSGLPATGTKLTVRGSVLSGVTLGGTHYGVTLNEAERIYPQP